MKRKYTQGKWIVQYPKNVGDFDIGVDGIISIVSIHDAYDNLEEQEANAKLIAAAPEQQEASILLYNLCRKLAGMLGHDSFDEIREDWNKAMNSHEQAIKKATE